MTAWSLSRICDTAIVAWIADAIATATAENIGSALTPEGLHLPPTNRWSPTIDVRHGVACNPDTTRRGLSKICKPAGWFDAVRADYTISRDATRVEREGRL